MAASNKISSLTFRLATAEDMAEITNLINAAFRSEATGQTWLYDSQDKRKDILPEHVVSSFISGTNSLVLVGLLLNETTISTCCYLRRPSTDPLSEPHRTPGAAWLGFLAVSPNKHKKGLGAAMLFQAEAYVREIWNVDLIELDAVSSRVQLRQWYNRCGYFETGQVRPFPYGEDDREILADGLEMVVKLKKLGENAVGYQKCTVQQS